MFAVLTTSIFRFQSEFECLAPRGFMMFPKG
jgi:hypothetical protein